MRPSARSPPCCSRTWRCASSTWRTSTSAWPRPSAAPWCAREPAPAGSTPSRWTRSARPTRRVAVWALGDLTDEHDRVLAAAVLRAVHSIWTELSRRDARRRVVILDEAWRIYETSEAAGRIVEALARRLAKGARKYDAGL